MRSTLTTLPLLALSVTLAGCSGGGSQTGAPTPPPTSSPAPAPTPTPTPVPTFAGAVYAGTNRISGNSVAAFGRNEDGSLTPIADFTTGGSGRSLDGANDGLDPLISEDSVLVVDNRYLLAVDAGSNRITSFRIGTDFRLTLIGSAPTGGTGPVSIAYRDGLVYVVNADSDGVFMTPADQSGNVSGLRIDLNNGQLTAISGSTRELGVRPSDVEFAPDGRQVVISGLNAGSTMLASRSTAEVLSYGVASDGRLTAAPQASVTSTLPGNAAGRNLPTAIGIEVVARGSRQFVVATEAREFLPSGAPGMLPMFQTGSVSTWELAMDGSLAARSQDVRTGPTLTSGPTSACWIAFAPNADIFWVTSASGATISSYRLNTDGTVVLIDGRAASGAPAVAGAANPLATADGFIDLAVSTDGRQLFQLLGLRGTINVYDIGANGALTRRQQATGLLPMSNIQGLAFAANRAP